MVSGVLVRSGLLREEEVRPSGWVFLVVVVVVLLFLPLSYENKKEEDDGKAEVGVYVGAVKFWVT